MQVDRVDRSAVGWDHKEQVGLLEQVTAAKVYSSLSRWRGTRVRRDSRISRQASLGPRQKTTIVDLLERTTLKLNQKVKKNIL